MTINDTRRHLGPPSGARFGPFPAAAPGARAAAQAQGWPETPYGQGVHPFMMAGIMR